MRRLFSAILLFLLAAGCTLKQYEVSHEELERLARLPSEERGARVLALQQTSYDSDSLSEFDATTGGPGVAIIPGGAWCGSGSSTRDDCSTRPSNNESTNQSSGDGTSADDAAAIALVALAVTGLVLGPIAVTEGVRHDGWVEMPADQPLYLVGPNRWTSLAELTLDDVRRSERAVTPAWGRKVRPIERRPLDRKGFAATLEFSAARLSPGREDLFLGYGGRAGFGYFPLHELGFLVGGQFAYGREPNDNRFLGRLFASAEFLPASLGIFHAGVFAEGGVAQYLVTTSGTASRSSAVVSAGPLFQVSLSTRLALGLRGGMTSFEALEGRMWAPEVGFGVFVY